MSNTVRYKDTPKNPISLNGVSIATVSLAGLLDLQIQFDPLTAEGNASGNRLYYRVDSDTDPATATIAGMNAEGFLLSGGDVEFHLSPADSDQTLHLLLTDASGAPVVGGADDRVFLTTYRCNP